MNYEHKGITITLLEGSGEFAATIDGKMVTKPSLPAMKKLIDGGNKDKAEYAPPITMLVLHPARDYSMRNVPNSEYPEDGFRTTVTRIEKNKGGRRGGWREGFSFQTKRGNIDSLIADTPENMAMIRSYWRVYEEAARVREQQDKNVQDELGKIVFVRAVDEAERKGVKR